MTSTADYDLVIPGLYIGNIYSTKDYNFLHTKDIKCVLSVTNNYVQLDKKKFKHLQFNVNDSPWQDLISIFDICYDFINNSLENNRNIYVHCDMGISRSATVVIAYLMKKYGDTYESCYSFLKRRRSIVYPNFGFQAQLKLYQKMNYQLGGNSIYHRLFKNFLIMDIPHNIYRFNVDAYMKFLTKKSPANKMPVASLVAEYACGGPAYTDSKGITYRCKGKYY